MWLIAEFLSRGAQEMVGKQWVWVVNVTFMNYLFKTLKCLLTGILLIRSRNIIDPDLQGICHSHQESNRPCWLLLRSV